MSERRVKILVVGVGGQGVLTAARLLGEAAVRSGSPAVLGQLHGISQRGGSVESSVLIGPGCSSFIEDGDADAVLGLEPLEGLRALPRMSGKTRVVLSTGRIAPYTLAQRNLPYPDMEKVLGPILESAAELILVDGPDVIRRARAPRSLNVAMVGALAGTGMLPFEDGALLDVIAGLGPPSYRDSNRRAFELGREAVAG